MPFLPHRPARQPRSARAALVAALTATLAAGCLGHARDRAPNAVIEGTLFDGAQPLPDRRIGLGAPSGREPCADVVATSVTDANGAFRLEAATDRVFADITVLSPKPPVHAFELCLENAGTWSLLHRGELRGQPPDALRLTCDVAVVREEDRCRRMLEGPGAT
jgi:hypothetical protein